MGIDAREISHEIGHAKEMFNFLADGRGIYSLLFTLYFLLESLCRLRR